MVDVLVVGAVAVGQVLDRLAPHVLEQRRVPVLEQALEEDPLAQAGLGDLHASKPAVLHRRVEHHRAPEDHVAAVRLDPLDRAALRAGGASSSISSSSASRVRTKPWTSTSGMSSCF